MATALRNYRRGNAASEQQPPLILRSLPPILGCGAIILGLLAWAGWLLDLTALKSGIARQSPMKFNGARCFIPLGLALWLQRNPVAGPEATAARQLAGRRPVLWA